MADGWVGFGWGLGGVWVGERVGRRVEGLRYAPPPLRISRQIQQPVEGGFPSEHSHVPDHPTRIEERDPLVLELEGVGGERVGGGGGLW